MATLSLTLEVDLLRQRSNAQKVNSLNHYGPMIIKIPNVIATRSNNFKM